MAGDPRVLLQQAERALKGASGGWSFFSDRSEKYENAANLFKQAANAFQMQEQYMEAGQAFERLAQIQSTNLNEPDYAANSLTDAFKVYRMCNLDDAVRVLSSVIQHYVVKGNRRRAATEKHNLAEIYELELRDIHKALEAYEQAGKWFKVDNSPA
ncbi:soluble NSF attachment protein [Aspergillus pseudoustus]|uniref:Soluble NSF attachment protein n=1 Tax=Aspergillus pseudoustus TaxID=1810923 RepID=A0ABR4IIY1_9EURO